MARNQSKEGKIPFQLFIETRSVRSIIKDVDTSFARLKKKIR